MERTLKQFLALGLIFGTQTVLAAPAGTPQDYGLKTNYRCQTNGAVVRTSEKIVSRGGSNVQEIKYSAHPGRNQSLIFGDREYMIWPRITKNTFEKNLNVLVKDESGKFKIAQEISLGESQKTTTSVAITLKRGTDEEKPVTCKIEMEWVKKAKS